MGVLTQRRRELLQQVRFTDVCDDLSGAVGLMIAQIVEMEREEMFGGGSRAGTGEGRKVEERS